MTDHPTRMSAGRMAGSGLALAFMLASCASPAGPPIRSSGPIATSAISTSATATEGAAPEATFLWVASIPEVAQTRTTIEILDGAGEVVSSHTFAAGEVLLARQDLMPGSYSLDVGDGRCRTSFLGGAGSETDVVVRLDIGVSDCRVDIEGIHQAGSVHAFGSVGGRVTGPVPTSDVIVDAISLDSPPNSVPPAVRLGESATFFITPLPPGQYEVRAIGTAGVLASALAEVPPGDAAIVEVDLPLP